MTPSQPEQEPSVMPDTVAITSVGIAQSLQPMIGQPEVDEAEDTEDDEDEPDDEPQITSRTVPPL